MTLEGGSLAVFLSPSDGFATSSFVEAGEPDLGSFANREERDAYTRLRPGLTRKDSRDKTKKNFGAPVRTSVRGEEQNSVGCARTGDISDLAAIFKFQCCRKLPSGSVEDTLALKGRL